MTSARAHMTNFKFDPKVVLIVTRITFKSLVRANITVAGNYRGIFEFPFTAFRLSNITSSIPSLHFFHQF